MANDRGGGRVAALEGTRVTEGVAKRSNLGGKSSTLARAINIDRYYITK